MKSIMKSALCQDFYFGNIILIVFFLSFCHNCRYIQYSNIAARVLRSSLKPELKADAAKRADSHVKFTKWTDGKPARKYTDLTREY